MIPSWDGYGFILYHSTTSFFLFCLYDRMWRKKANCKEGDRLLTCSLESECVQSCIVRPDRCSTMLLIPCHLNKNLTVTRLTHEVTNYTFRWFSGAVKLNLHNNKASEHCGSQGSRFSPARVMYFSLSLEDNNKQTSHRGNDLAAHLDAQQFS